MLAKKIAYNTAIQILGKVLGFFISGIFLIAVAERLGTEGMGQYVTILAFVGFFVTLADLGANLLMVRDISQNEENRVEITGEYLGFRLSFSLLVMALAPFAAMLIPQYSELIVKGVVIITVAQFLLLINQMFISMLQTQLMLDKAVLAEIMNRVINLGLVFGAIFLNLTGTSFFYAVLYAALIGSLINLFITFFFARRLWAITPRIDFATWKKTLIAIAPIGLFSFLGIVHFKADTILLSLMRPSEDVGIYGYAYKIGEIIFTFPVMFVGAVFPKLSQLLVSSKTRFKQLAQLSFDALFMGTIPFLAFVFVAAKYFTLILSRADFQDGITAGITLQLLVFAFFSWFLGTLFIHILIMGNEYKGLIRNLAIAVGINIILNLIFIPHYSYYAAAVNTGITEMVMVFLTLHYMKMHIGFMPQIRFLSSTLVSTIIMLLGVLYLSTLPLFTYEAFAATSRFAQMGLLVSLGVVAGVLFLVPFWFLGGKNVMTLFRAIRDDRSDESEE